MGRYAVHDNVLNALIRQESGGNNNAISSVGARGVTQVMPKTARDPGFGVTPLRDGSEGEYKRFGKEYLGAMLDRYEGNLPKALAAYNAGPGTVDKAGGVPKIKETVSYIDNIMSMLKPMGTANASEETWTPPPGAPSPQEWLKQHRASTVTPQGVPDPQEWLRQHRAQKSVTPEVQYHGRNVSDMSGASKFLIGAGNSVLDLGRGAAQMVGMGNDADIKDSRELTNELNKSGAGMAGNIAGAIAPALFTGGTSLPAVVGSSAALSALQPTMGDESRLKNTAIGAASGAVGKSVGAGLGRMAKGFTASDDAIALMNNGVQPTVGQGISQTGMVGKGIRKAEEATQSLPFLGAITEHARSRAANEWTKATIKAAEDVKLGITAAGETGSKAITNLKNSFNSAYEKALAGHKVDIKPDFGQGIVDRINAPDLFMNPAEREQATKMMQALLTKITPDGSGKYLASDIRKVESLLGDKAATLTAAGDEKAILLKNIKDFIAGYRESALPSNVKGTIKAINSKYANYKRLERASSGVGALDGEYSPAQLYNASKAMDKSKDKTLSAQGKAIMQELSSQGKNVISNKLGDSGTAGRLLTNKLLAGGALEGAAVISAPVQSAILGAGMLAGQSRPVQKALLGGYAGQKALSKNINKLSPVLGMAGANVAIKNKRAKQ